MSEPAWSGIEVIAEPECRRLLGDAHLGRLGFAYRTLPVVLPVNFSLRDEADEVLFRTESPSILSAAIARDVACLEVDDHDLIDHAGWSVLATGHLEEIEDPAALDELHEMALPTWRPMARPHYLRLSIEMISGRRVHPGRAPDHPGPPPRPDRY